MLRICAAQFLEAERAGDTQEQERASLSFPQKTQCFTCSQHDQLIILQQESAHKNRQGHPACSHHSLLSVIMSVTSEEINYLIFRYLQESGMRPLRLHFQTNPARPGERCISSLVCKLKSTKEYSLTLLSVLRITLQALCIQDSPSRMSLISTSQSSETPMFSQEHLSACCRRDYCTWTWSFTSTKYVLSYGTRYDRVGLPHILQKY